MAYQVDYKELKEKISIGQVLDYYGLTSELRTTKEGYEGLCPFHETKHLERRPFKVNTEKNAFHCFSCKAKGNILDFVALKENDTVHGAALKLKAWFLGDSKSVAAISTAANEPKATNQPLTFTLKLESEHPHLKHLPITLETLQAFGAGYCNRGLHQGRLAIPVQNQTGELIAYISYSLTAKNPYDDVKYPENFDPGLVLFNYHPSIEETKPLLLFPTVLDFRMTCFLNVGR
jgi:DNA primase